MAVAGSWRRDESGRRPASTGGPVNQYHAGMCLIALAWRAHPRYPLIVVANRDEFHDRPAAPLAEWPDAPGVYGGRDLRAGGAWLALGSGGRLAAVTNVRESRAPAPGLRSRGALATGFLQGALSAPEAAQELMVEAERYGCLLYTSPSPRD